MNYFRYIIRKLANNKVYTIINVLGLAIAMTTALLIYTFVENENNTDQWHKNGHKIYRFTQIMKENQQSWGPHCCNALPEFAVKEIPGIEKAVRISSDDDLSCKSENMPDFIGGYSCFETDSTFFEIFSFPVCVGETSNFNINNWIVITESCAYQFFGHENPVGKNIRLKDKYSASPSDYVIKAVIRNFFNSSLKADFILPYKNGNRSPWNSWGPEAFFLISENTDIATVEKSMKDIVSQHSPYFSELKIQLQPFQDMYLGSAHVSDSYRHGSVLWNNILYGIGILILSIAFSNYLIIAMARTSSDITFFTIQKCFGATNRHFLHRLFSEIGLHFTSSLLLSFIFTAFFYTSFTRMISSGHSGKSILFPQEYLAFILLSGALFIAAGFILYTHTKTQMNQKSIKYSFAAAIQKIKIKQTLSIVQMCIFCTMLFCSFIIAKQVYYVKNASLGYYSDNMLSFRPGVKTPETLKENFKNNPDILSVTHGTQLPIYPGFTDMSVSLMDGTEKKEFICNVIPADETYIETYGIRLTAGKKPEFRNHNNDSGIKEILVNQKFVEKAGLTQPIGTLLQTPNSDICRIVGITEDFHTQSLYHPLKPAMTIYGSFWVMADKLIVSYKDGKRNEVMKYLKEINPAFTPIEWRISDVGTAEHISGNDQMVTKLIYLFTGIALFIGAMGIFAYSLFMATERKKEVAIRKVNGATEWEILQKLNHGFILRTLLACGISIPVAVYATGKWLEQFAYQTTLPWWIFPLITGICICLVVSVTSWQTWKAAIQNPIDSIKSE